jgi:hypothetical protein
MTYDHRRKPGDLALDSRLKKRETDLHGIIGDLMSSDASYEAFILCHYEEERLRALGVLQ